MDYDIPTDIVEIVKDIVAYEEIMKEDVIDEGNLERIYITDVNEIIYEDVSENDIKIEINL